MKIKTSYDPPTYTIEVHFEPQYYARASKWNCYLAYQGLAEVLTPEQRERVDARLMKHYRVWDLDTQAAWAKIGQAWRNEAGDAW